MGHEAGLAVPVWAVRAALEVPEWVVRVAPVGAWDDEYGTRKHTHTTTHTHTHTTTHNRTHAHSKYATRR
jgi:hypothetical protein